MQTAPMKITASPNHQGRSRSKAINIPSVQQSQSLQAGPGKGWLFAQPGVLEDLIDAITFALDERAEFGTRQKVAIPSLLVEHCLPFFAFTKLGKTHSPFLMIGFRHIDRNQKSPTDGA